MKRRTIDLEKKDGGYQTTDGAVCRLSSAVHPATDSLQLPTINHQLPTERKRAAFTLLEVLVASLLMGMLVTILTMIFNQSSIAWRTGRASVADLSKITQNQSVYQYVADSAIPFLGNGKSYCVASPWRDADNSSAAKSKVRDRGIVRVSALPGEKRIPFVPSFAFENTSINGLSGSLGSSSAAGGENYVVGVRSAGPDKEFAEKGVKFGEDDISTIPEEVE